MKIFERQGVTVLVLAVVVLVDDAALLPRPLNGPCQRHFMPRDTHELEEPFRRRPSHLYL